MSCIACGNPSCRGCHVEHNHVHINHTNADKCGTHSHSPASTSCAPCGTETPVCESLSSQIANFTTQFFGVVVKTELNGVISWSLPCNLDVGLENNPRLPDEGLACYFLRLFEEGIVGLTGPEGAQGSAGTNGRNAYTVTLASFAQPSSVNPNVQVLTSYNPAILEDMYIFIATSGWYTVNENDPSGMLFLTFAQASQDAPAAGTIVNAGKLVVPSGFPGIGTQGPQGNPGAQGTQGSQGIQGIQGEPGVSPTTANEFYFDAAGTNDTLPSAYAPVDFVSSAPTVTLAESGTYLVTVAADILGLAGISLADAIFLKLINDTTALNVPGTEHVASNMVLDERRELVINVILTTLSDNEIITLYGRCTSAGVAAVVATRTTMTFVRIA